MKEKLGRTYLIRSLLLVAGRRLRTRKIGGVPKAVGKRIVQLQDELAFHKAFVAQRGGAPEDDAPVVALRTLIAAERAGAPDAAQTA